MLELLALPGKLLLKVLLLLLSEAFGAGLGDWLLFGLGKRTSHLHVQFLYVVSVLEHFCGSQLAGLFDLCDFIFSKANNHVFRLEVSVNNFALAVHVI